MARGSELEREDRDEDGECARSHMYDFELRLSRGTYYWRTAIILCDNDSRHELPATAADSEILTIVLEVKVFHRKLEWVISKQVSVLGCI